MAKDDELLEDEEELEEVEETETKKEKKQTNHGAFAETIKAYLDGYSKEDAIFAARYSNPEKNINECCNYIINQVKTSGRNGFADEEIFAMARGYYTDDIKDTDLKSTKATVVVNHTIELTEAEKQKAREKAIKDFEAQEIKKLEAAKKKEELEKQKAKEKEELAKQKAEEKRIKAEEEKKAKQEQAAKERGFEQLDLFGMLEG